MRDKALDIFLMALFGMGGITILVLACVQPMPIAERILTVFIGLMGLLWFLSRVPLLGALLAKR